MISTKGIPEITCQEKDIRMLCPTDQKDKNGFALYKIYIYIADVEKPVASSYDSPQARDEDYRRIRSAWQASSGKVEDLCKDVAGLKAEVGVLKVASASMKQAVEKTKLALDEWGRKQAEEDRKLAETARKAKATSKTKAKAAKAFVPPTDEDIIKCILENGYEKAARQKPEGIAKRFRRFYMRDGKTWRLANGRPMKDWKKALATWINNIDEDIEELETAQETGRTAAVKANSFTSFENQNAYDESLEEDLLRISEEAYETVDKEQDQEKQKAQDTAGKGIPA